MKLFRFLIVAVLLVGVSGVEGMRRKREGRPMAITKTDIEGASKRLIGKKLDLSGRYYGEEIPERVTTRRGRSSGGETDSEEVVEREFTRVGGRRMGYVPLSHIYQGENLKRLLRHFYGQFEELSFEDVKALGRLPVDLIRTLNLRLLNIIDSRICDEIKRLLSKFDKDTSAFQKFERICRNAAAGDRNAVISLLDVVDEYQKADKANKKSAVLAVLKGMRMPAVFRSRIRRMLRVASAPTLDLSRCLEPSLPEVKEEEASEVPEEIIETDPLLVALETLKEKLLELARRLTSEEGSQESVFDATKELSRDTGSPKRVDVGD
jgi:hypothetical protein